MHTQWLLLVLLYAVAIQASDITSVVFGDIKEGVVAAFGDFNSDELTDIFVIQDDRKMLQILFGECMLIEEVLYSVFNKYYQGLIRNRCYEWVLYATSGPEEL